MPALSSFANRHPWLWVVYLLTITCAAFLTPQAWKAATVAALVALQLTVLGWSGKLDGAVIRLVNRLKFLFAFLVVVNALLPGETGDRYWVVTDWLWIDLTGAAAGVLMSAQILLVVLTTHVVRSIGDERSFINGLR
jgi:hypothetical protein